MPDIQLRFAKDMLVMSTPLTYQLHNQGFTRPADQEYVVLCEPELIEEAYKLEKVIEVPCFVTPTEGITDARLMHARFEGRADEMASIAYETAAQFTPQHIVAAIGPTGLPLDPSSQASLKQLRDQYKEAVRALAVHPFDAMLFSGFNNPFDAQAALMGARMVYDGPVMISLAPHNDGTFSSGHTLKQAAQLCVESGADVVGFHSGAEPAVLIEFAQTMAAAVSCPLMAEIVVKQPETKTFDLNQENPYAVPDALIDVAWNLRAAGIQFLRAAGLARPAYTATLLGVVSGHDVVCVHAKGSEEG